ncbi:MAG: hypothetical protein JWP97_3823 [Labilithrix sp.]|nr:hypothetical protein [Labilithrix sp.]
MRHSLLLAGLLTATASLSVVSDAYASSHREAPFITKNPKVDGTDFYMFQSYSADRIQGDGTSEYTTLVANYIPLQDAFGGPNYFSFDPEAIYEIHVENSGDAVEDITFQFKFTNALAGGGKGVQLDIGGKKNSVPTVQANVTVADAPTPITAGNETMLLNVQESYTINMIKGPRRSSAGTPVKNATGGATSFIKPVDNIGARTFGEAAGSTNAYKAYADAHIYSVMLDGCAEPAKVFVGQRQEGFRVNLGLIFDLVNAPLGTITDPTKRNAFNGTPFDNTAQKNVTSIAMEIPTHCLTSDAKPAAASARPVIGGWTTASVRQARLINPDATYEKPTREGGAWTQVSRLGMPLTNEVVIGIADKDKWNSSEPGKDTQFLDYVTNPTLPQILQAIFGGASTPIFPAASVARTDLVDIFLKGVPGVNVTGSTAEMLRLNTKLPTKGTGKQTGGNFAGGNALSGLGAAGCFAPALNCKPAGKTQADCYTVVPGPACDTGGFPNGRRPGDDVTDIELTALLGYFVPQAGFGGTVLHDAVLNEESQFDATFPYLKTPHSGDPQ